MIKIKPEIRILNFMKMSLKYEKMKFLLEFEKFIQITIPRFFQSLYILF